MSSETCSSVQYSRSAWAELPRRWWLQLRGDAEFLEEVEDCLTDTVDDKFDVTVGDVVCRGDDDVISTIAVNCTGSWIHIDVISIFQP